LLPSSTWALTGGIRKGSGLCHAYLRVSIKLIVSLEDVITPYVGAINANGYTMKDIEYIFQERSFEDGKVEVGIDF